MPVQFVPGVRVMFLADVCTGFPTWIANDRSSECVLKPVDGAGQPEVQVLSSDAAAQSFRHLFGDYILPTEQVDNAEPVVGGRMIVSNAPCCPLALFLSPEA